MKLKHLFTLLVCGTLLFACESGGSEDDVNPKTEVRQEPPSPLDVFDDADAIKPLFISLFKVYSDISVKNYELYSGLKHDKYWIGIVTRIAQDQYEKYYEWTDKNAIEKVKYVDVGYGETEKYRLSGLRTSGIGLSDNNYIVALTQVYKGGNEYIVETRLLVIKGSFETIKDLPNPIIHYEPYKWYGDTVLLQDDNKYTCYDGDGNVVQQIVMPMSYMSANDIDKLKQQLLRIDRGLYISDGSIIYWNFTTGQVIGQVKFDDLPSNARLDNFEIIERSNGTAKIKVNHTLYSGEKAARECSINIETGEISYSNSDGYGIIETPTIQGTELVRKVVAVMDDKPRPEYEIATADFVNGKFSLKLPLTLPSDKLMPMTERFDLPDGVTMTPSTAYGDAVNIDACDANGKQIGVLSMEGATKDDFAVYMYVDRNVQITGSSTSTYDGVDYKNVYDISLVKGWNLLYYKKEFIKGTEGKNDKYVDTQTTNKMSVKWVYYTMDEW